MIFRIGTEHEIATNIPRASSVYVMNLFTPSERTP